MYTFVAREADRLDHLGQELPRAADEGDALDVFIAPRGLAGEHQRRVRIAHAEDNLAAAEAMQLAARAVADVLADRREADWRTGQLNN